MLLLASCGEKAEPSDLWGLWKYELNGKYREVITEVIADERVYVDIYYQFNEDGTGRTYASDGSFDREFTYTFSDDTITITSSGYSFEQKCKLTPSTLTIRDESGENVVFEKQNMKG